MDAARFRRHGADVVVVVAGVLTGGMFSVPVIRAIGACFMTTGIAATLTAPEWGNIWLAIGFGGLHIGFGAYIARHYGG